MQQPESTKQEAVWWLSLNKAESIMRKIEKRARNEFLPIVGSEKGRILAEEIRKGKARAKKKRKVPIK
jgi:hypothetical protein